MSGVFAASPGLAQGQTDQRIKLETTSLDGTRLPARMLGDTSTHADWLITPPGYLPEEMSAPDDTTVQLISFTTSW